MYPNDVALHLRLFRLATQHYHADGDDDEDDDDGGGGGGDDDGDDGDDEPLETPPPSGSGESSRAARDSQARLQRSLGRERARLSGMSIATPLNARRASQQADSYAPN